MGLTAADYAGMLRALLPPGAVWRAAPGSVQAGILDGWGAELARIDGRAGDLRRESLPETVSELLDEWEAEFGLPEPCDTRAGLTDEERLARLVAKVYYRAQRGPGRWHALAAQYGVTISLEQFQPSKVGQVELDVELMSDDARFGWRIMILSPPVEVALPELDCELPVSLGDWPRSPFECAARQRNPAHMVLIVGYTEEA